VAQLDGVVRQMKADHATAIDELRDTAAALVKQMGATRPATIQAMQSNITEPTGDTGASTPENQRRLQQEPEGSTPTYAAMPAWQVHEFPNGGTCSLGSRMRLLPKNRVGDGLSWSVSNADAASDLSLVTLGGTSHWATSDVQSMPYPLKVVHDASCSNPPMLDLPLSTTVQTLTVSGTLTVAGMDIGSRILALEASGSGAPYCTLTFAGVTLNSGITSTSLIGPTDENAASGSPGMCIGVMLQETTQCSQVSRQVLYKSSNGMCRCNPSATPWVSTDFSSGGVASVYTTEANTRCV